MLESRASLVAPDRLRPFAPGISWAVLPGDGMTLVYWLFEPPACGDVPLHQHAVAQGGVVYTLQGNAPHGATFTERCVVLDVFAPNRVEYEQRFAAGTTAEQFVIVGADA
jgi:hypothetical protein